MSSRSVERRPRPRPQYIPNIPLADLVQHAWESNPQSGRHEVSRDEYVDQFTTLVRSQVLGLHQPVSTEARRTQDLVTIVNNLHLESAWVSLVPARLGHSRQVDLAVQSVIEAYLFRTGERANNSATAYEVYGEAVTTLQSNISSSDDSLLTVALLSLFEALMESNVHAHNSHNEGVEKILLARETPELTGLERAMLYSNLDRKFRVPVALGIASPFEHTQWLDLDPPERPNTSPEVRRLEKLAHQLFIRLPRLITYTRSLLDAVDQESADLPSLANDTICLAEELLQLEDEAAESRVLHIVGVRPTIHDDDASVAPFSFEFESLYQLQASACKFVPMYINHF